MSKLSCFLLVVFLVGCASTNSDDRSLNKEALLIQAQNYNELVGYYKSQLSVRDTEEVRIKLARSYLKIKDADSALFILKPLMAQKKISAEALLL
ncbi:hypothetical protein REH72_22355, partial [Vibrio sinaloensis]